MLELHQRAMRHSVVIVSLVSAWDGPTPCAEWTLRRLVSHLAATNNGYAAAAGGETVDDAWTEADLGEDPRRDYAESADRVVKAFESAESRMWLPHLGETVGFEDAIGYHLLETVVHAWDVAAALGRTLALEPDLVAVAHEVANQDGPHRAIFGPATGADETDPLRGLLALTGRDPDWRPFA